MTWEEHLERLGQKWAKAICDRLRARYGIERRV